MTWGTMQKQPFNYRAFLVVIGLVGFWAVAAYLGLVILRLVR